MGYYTSVRWPHGLAVEDAWFSARRTGVRIPLGSPRPLICSDEVPKGMGAIGKVLLGLGAVLVAVGLLLIGLERLGVRSWRLPGDIAIQRDGFAFYFPLGTSILISLVLTLLLTFWAWLSARGR